MAEEDELYTMVMVGGGGVGKSCLTVQFLTGRFSEEYDPTIEESYRKQVLVNDRTCQLEIIDTAGQEVPIGGVRCFIPFQEYSSMRDGHLSSGDGFMLVYSITSAATFAEAKELNKLILRVTDKARLPLVLCGNKCDMETYRQVAASEGQSLASQIGCPFFETSAKTRKNVEAAYLQLVKEMRQKNHPSGKAAQGCCVLL